MGINRSALRFSLSLFAIIFFFQNCAEQGFVLPGQTDQGSEEVKDTGPDVDEKIEGFVDANFQGGMLVRNVGDYEGIDHIEATSATIQNANGQRYLVVGGTFRRNASNVARDAIIMRFNMDGTPDTLGFQNSGPGWTSFIIPGTGDVNDLVKGIVTNDLGELFVAGETTVDNVKKVFVRKLRQGGQLDVSYNTFNGVVDDIVANDRHELRGVKMQPDGKLVMGIQVGASTPLLLRFMPDGSRDESFGPNGAVLITASGFISDIELTKEGQILAVGTNSTRDVFVTRVNAGGGLDASFGSNGTQTTNLANPEGSAPAGVDSYVGEIIVQPDGKVLIGGAVEDMNSATRASFAIVRLNSDGSIDKSFASDGLFTLNVDSNRYDRIDSMSMHNGKKILISGGNSLAQHGLYRLNSDGSLDNSFASQGRLLLPFSSTKKVSQIIWDGLDSLFAIGGYFAATNGGRIEIVKVR